MIFGIGNIFSEVLSFLMKTCRKTWTENFTKQCLTETLMEKFTSLSKESNMKGMKVSVQKPSCGFCFYLMVVINIAGPISGKTRTNFMLKKTTRKHTLQKKTLDY